jgi:serine/threonine protein kinase
LKRRTDRGKQTPVIRALSNEPVNGRWLLTGLAGRGSSATVYRAFDLVDERLVAIKSLGERGSPAHLCRRARREFLGMSSLRHPHLVETYEYGEARSGPLAPGSPFFTMELLEGAGLTGGGPTCARRLARAALGLLAALECVHGHGLVHGDVKPSNVLADARGARRALIKLGDLGLARRPRSGAGDGRLSGTLHYAAPERIAGGPTDGRSDLYSLGVLLYEAATGSLPFDEADPAAALAWHLRAVAREADEGASLPPALSRVIGRLLRTRMDERYARAREAWEEIAEVLPDEADESPNDSDTCDGPLIGRSRERAFVARWLASRGGEGGFLEIAGPPGSGVSRLSREAAQSGRALGWSVHAWSCRADDPPFAPLSRPLREIILRGCPGVMRKRVPTEGEVLALLGGPALWSAPDRLVEHAGPPLAGAIAAFLAEGAGDRPRLIVLDDADGLDRGSALVLRALASTMSEATRGFLVIAAAHAPASDVPSARALRRDALPAIRPHLARAAGNPALPVAAARSRIELGALSECQSRRLVASLPGIGALTAREVEAIVRAAEGMPGRIARLARSMAGRQLALFPPVCEPRRLS